MGVEVVHIPLDCRWSRYRCAVLDGVEMVVNITTNLTTRCLKQLEKRRGHYILPNFRFGTKTLQHSAVEPSSSNLLFVHFDTVRSSTLTPRPTSYNCAWPTCIGEERLRGSPEPTKCPMTLQRVRRMGHRRWRSFYDTQLKSTAVSSSFFRI
jgi:hypothetical protein